MSLPHSTWFEGMKQDNFVPLAEAISVIEQLAERNADGTLFLGTKTNQYAQMAFKQGKITFLYFQNKRGQDALSLLAKVQECKYRFQTTVLSSLTDNLPPFATILQILRGEAGQKPTESVSVQSKQPLTSEQKELLQGYLVDYVGPAASLLVDEYCQKNRDIQTVINALAAEIPDEAEAQQFRRKVGQRFL